jgi:hypothetical protein
VHTETNLLFYIQLNCTVTETKMLELLAMDDQFLGKVTFLPAVATVESYKCQLRFTIVFMQPFLTCFCLLFYDKVSIPSFGVLVLCWLHILFCTLIAQNRLWVMM